MLFNKKLVLIYIVVYLSNSYAMEMQDIASKEPKLLQEICLGSFCRKFIQRCVKKEEINALLQELKNLSISEIINEQINSYLLVLSDYTSRLALDRVIRKKINDNEEIITINSAQFHPLTNYLICAYTNRGNHFLGLWNSKTKNFYTFRAQSEYNCIGFSKEGNYITSSCRNNNDYIIGVWDTDQINIPNEFVCHSKVNGLCFSDDDKYIIAILESGRKVWNLASKEEVTSEETFVDVNNKLLNNKVIRARVERAIQELGLSESGIKAIHIQRLNNKINLITRSGWLITLKSTKNKLDKILKNCSLEKTAQLISLSESTESKKCLSCKKIKLNEEIEKLLLDKSTVTIECDLCKNENA